MRSLYLYLISILIAYTEPSWATTYLIQPDGTGDFPTIQEAVDAAVTGDTIRLADGTHRNIYPDGIFFGGKDIVFGSLSGDPEACIIDAEGGRGFNISFEETRAAVVEGITIMGGYMGFGGGGFHIRRSAPTIRNCIIRENYGQYGGGISAQNLSSPLIANCHIHHNSTSPGDFGGGGIQFNGEAEITGCIIEDNYTGTEAVSGGGGAIAGNGSAIIQDCIIRNNSGGVAGGALHMVGEVDLINCLIYGNHAGVYASAIIIYGAPWTEMNISNCTIVGNDCPDGPAILNHYYFTGYGSGMVRMENSILAFNPGGKALDNAYPVWLLDFKCTNIYGHDDGDWNFPYDMDPAAQGNLCADPLFCDLDAFDLTLRSNSPCLPHGAFCDTIIGALGQGCVITAIEETPPAGVRLAQNTPNPFNATTRIAFHLDRDLPVTLRIVDLRGRVLATVMENESLPAGDHSLMWDGTDAQGNTLPSGVYLVCLRTGERLLSRKMTMVK